MKLIMPKYLADIHGGQKVSPMEIQIITAIAMTETVEDALMLLKELNSALVVKFGIELDKRKKYIRSRTIEFRSGRLNV